MKLTRAVCAVVLFVASCVPVRAMPPVVWLDDFIGMKLDARYSISTVGTGFIRVSPNITIGGWAELYTLASGSGTARFRLGEEPSGCSTCPIILNWYVSKNASMEARVILNTATKVDATVGFVGLNDPNVVVAALVRENLWYFQVYNVSAGLQYSAVTTFHHVPGDVYLVRIETIAVPVPTARLLVDGVVYAELTDPRVPLSGLLPELQIWNYPLSSAWSQVTLWVDILSLTQDR